MGSVALEDVVVAVILDDDRAVAPEERDAVSLADLRVVDLRAAELAALEPGMPPVLTQLPSSTEEKSAKTPARARVRSAKPWQGCGERSVGGWPTFRGCWAITDGDVGSGIRWRWRFTGRGCECG